MTELRKRKHRSIEGKLKLVRRLVDEYLERNYSSRLATLETSGPVRENGRASWAEYVGKASLAEDQPEETIIIVAHEASYTGAPKTALELGIGLSRKYSIVYILMKPGPRLQDFIDSGDVVIVSNGDTPPSNLISHLVGSRKIKAVILNSILTAEYAPSFLEFEVPTLCYVHEFYQTVSSRIAQICFSYCTELIFSAEIVFRSYRNPQNREPHIVPQGLLEIGTGLSGGSDLLAEIERNPDTKLVVGAGTGLVRKGVDLFIETCRLIQVSLPKVSLVFLWLGDDWNVHNAEVGMLLRQQIEQSQMGQSLRLVTNADTGRILSRADLFILTSRLDPLPNVAVEAALLQTPVLAFSKTSGIPDLLRMNKSLTATPFDTRELAKKASRLLINEALRQRLGHRLSKQARQVTDFEAYIERFDSLIEESDQTVKGYRAKSVKLSELLASHEIDFDPDEIAPQRFAYSRSSGRPPEILPGFSSRIFSMYRKGIHPGPEGVLEYLKEGLPSGPWITERIVRRRLTVSPGLARTVVHVHSAHTEGLDEILKIVRSLPPDVRVVLTCPEEFISIHEARARSLLLGMQCEVVGVENWGRNFGALRQLFLTRKMAESEFLCHLHNKQSPHADRKMVERWRSDLFQGLLERQMLNSIVSALRGNPEIGMVYPEDRSLDWWADNFQLSQEFGKSLGLENLPQQPDYPVGGMFVARVKPIQEIFTHPSLSKIQISEPIETDGEYVHSLERLLPLLVLRQGYGVGKSAPWKSRPGS